jgi:hypothetical protein
VLHVYAGVERMRKMRKTRMRMLFQGTLWQLTMLKSQLELEKLFLMKA